MKLISFFSNLFRKLNNQSDRRYYYDGDSDAFLGWCIPSPTDLHIGLEWFRNVCGENSTRIKDDNLDGCVSLRGNDEWVVRTQAMLYTNKQRWRLMLLKPDKKIINHVHDANKY